MNSEEFINLTDASHRLQTNPQTLIRILKEKILDAPDISSKNDKGIWYCQDPETVQYLAEQIHVAYSFIFFPEEWLNHLDA